MRLLVTGGLPLVNGIMGLGGEITWPRQARHGDSLHVDSEILDITPSRSKPNQAVVSVRSTMLNQKDEAVYVLDAKVLVFKRPCLMGEASYGEWRHMMPGLLEGQVAVDYTPAIFE
jgi:acyl dehydratase